ncbi:MAG: cob(I)yrinic acid a,c-diamide adenosyltransferase [Bacteroidota bacterium]
MGFKIYTKTGDDGTTGLVGGNRVRKSNLRLDAYGTVDELNAHIGYLQSMMTDNSVIELLLEVQNKLFVIGSKLASDEKGKEITNSLECGGSGIERLERAIDEYDSELKPLSHFILPAGSAEVSYCHIARTVCRRAERRVVQLAENSPVEEMIIQYLNRLSDYLFVLSRKVAKDQGVEEIPWTHD